MEVISEDKKISLYGNLNITVLNTKKEEKIRICVENKKVRKIGDYLYDFLQKQYDKYDYNWNNIKKEIRITKLVTDNEVINSKCLINIYGYVEDRRGLPSGKWKKYNFWIEEISIENIASELESLYYDYIYEFDTVKEGLKFVIKKIEVIKKAKKSLKMRKEKVNGK